MYEERSQADGDDQARVDQVKFAERPVRDRRGRLVSVLAGSPQEGRSLRPDHHTASKQHMLPA